MTAPQTEINLLAMLESLDISYEIIRHPPLHTVAESQELRGQWDGGHAKCLFLKDKKGQLALAVVEENRRVDMNALAKTGGFARLSFGKPDLMQDVLGVRPGAVTPFALINAMAKPGEEPPLRLVLDSKLLTLSPLHFHPLHNQATVRISADGLLRFLGAMGYDPMTLDFDDLEKPET